MPDPWMGALINAGATLLGSLNKRTAMTDLEAAKLLDQEDPIKRTLEAFPVGAPIDARMIFANGTEARLTEVLEIGFGAARVELQIQQKETVGGTVTHHFGPTVAAVVRFSTVSIITVPAAR